MLVMLDEEYDPDMVPEAEEAVNAVGKAVDELQLMNMLNEMCIRDSRQTQDQFRDGGLRHFAALLRTAVGICHEKPRFLFDTIFT